jgi:hypothetical protein
VFSKDHLSQSLALAEVTNASWFAFVSSYRVATCRAAIAAEYRPALALGAIPEPAGGILYITSRDFAEQWGQA